MELEKSIEELTKDTKEIKKLLLGNGKIGIAEMARRAYEHMQQYNQSKNTTVDWIFRGIITIVLGFIAAKVGLK